MDVGALLRRDLAEHLSKTPNCQTNCHLFNLTLFIYLHADDSVDEEDEGDEDGDPGQRLEGLDEGPEEGADALALAQQLDQAHHAEQTEEVDGDHVAARLNKMKTKRHSHVILTTFFIFPGSMLGALPTI